MNFEPYFKQYLEAYAKTTDPLWNYETGLVAMGARDLYEITGDESYLQAVISHMDFFITPDGAIRTLDTRDENLDRINAGKILFYLYKKTGEERYRTAIETLMEMLRRHPRTSTGNFWHKRIYPYQIWLDGLYMALPFYLEYETTYNQKENYNDIFFQMTHVRKIMYNKNTHLYIHAYDEKKIMPWADPQTGLSHNYWLRAVGWHLMALIDLHEICSLEVFEQHKQYADWFKEAIQGVLKYQDPELKLFYQLMVLPSLEGNYLETSGSAMIAYSILKGCRLGVLNMEKYRPIGEEILKALEEQKLQLQGGKWYLTDICSVAGLGPANQRDGSIAYYLSEPIVSDDMKGTGAAMLAYAEWLKLKKADETLKPSKEESR